MEFSNLFFEIFNKNYQLNMLLGEISPNKIILKFLSKNKKRDKIWETR